MAQHAEHVHHFSRGPGTLSVPVTLHVETRKKIRDRLLALNLPQAGSVIYLEGGKPSFRSNTDHEDIFRQESFFHYLFGVKEPDFAGAIDLGTGHATLFIPRLPASYAIWMGPLYTTEDYKHMYGVDECLYTDNVESWLDTHVAPHGKIYMLQGENSDSDTIFPPPTLPGKFKTHPAIELNTLYHVLSDCRVTKTKAEQEVMKYICKVSSDAHEHVMKTFRPGDMEYGCESDFIWHASKIAGCRHVGYTCICASGNNGATLHYGHAGEPNNKQIKQDEMLLFDMGAEYYCYSADITRTFPSSGKFNAKQRIIYTAVLEAQEAVLQKMKPGVFWPDMQRVAYQVIVDHMKKAHLLNDYPTDEMIAADIGYCFMPHGLGHLLGLETHDVGGVPPGTVRSTQRGFKSVRCQRNLIPGMVITVEPGIYFNMGTFKMFMDDPATAKYFNAAVIETYAGFGGVRIEDDVLVTEEGILNLTTVPKSIEAIEALLAQNPNLKQ